MDLRWTGEVSEMDLIWTGEGIAMDRGRKFSGKWLNCSKPGVQTFNKIQRYIFFRQLLHCKRSYLQSL